MWELEGRQMPTKTHLNAGEYRIESENIESERGVETSDYVGTAMSLVEALENSGETMAKITVEMDIGKPKITIFGRYGNDGEPRRVPREVHKQLLEWGFEHRGGEDYSYTDEERCHVYVK
jgi:hypothetical protein